MTRPYTVLVVEDEPRIRRDLIRRLTDCCRQLTVVGEARTATEGAALFRQLNPELVLADIVMSGQSGLDMLGDLPREKAILAVVTGHKQFEYARQALQIGVEHFLLKPVRQTDLESLCETVLPRLRKRRRERESSEYRHIFQYGSENPAPLLWTAALNIGGWAEKPEHCPRGFAPPVNTMQSLLDSSSVTDVVHVLPSGRRNLLFLVARWVDVTAHSLMPEQVTAAALPHRRSSLVYCDRPVAPEQFPQHTQTLVTSLRRTIQLGRSSTTTLDAEPAHSQNVRVPEGFTERLAALLQEGHLSAAVAELSTMLSQWNDAGTQASFGEFISEMLGGLAGSLKGFRVVADAARDQIGKAMVTLPSAKEIAQHALRVIQTEIIEPAVAPRGEGIAAIAEQYLRRHLSVPVSMSDVCEYLGYHPTHVARRFSESFGTSPMAYLTNLRIETAKELLSGNPELSCRAIGQQVGYEDHRYFYRLFKKHTGQTPSSYRATATGSPETTVGRGES